MKYRMRDNGVFEAINSKDLVDKMMAESAGWQPAESAKKFMRDFAAREKTMSGRDVRHDSPTSFVADLVAAGILESVK